MPSEFPAINQCQRKMRFSVMNFIQLNKYETDPYFPQIFQSNTSVCLIISLFCKSCELKLHLCYITLRIYRNQNKQFHVQCSVHKSYKTRKWTSFCIGNYEKNMNLSRIYLPVNPRHFIFWSDDLKNKVSKCFNISSY